MKLFISWSGPTSQQVADALRNWIPSVLQSVKPFMSAVDTDKGIRWNANLSQQLADADYGIICVTPDNLDSRWLNFEAGAISKSIDTAYVSPFLFGIKSSAVTGPLVQFQHTVYSRPDIFQLIKSINNVCAEPIPEVNLPEIFGTWWPRLESALSKVSAPPPAGSVRSAEDMLTELVDSVRTLQKTVSAKPIDAPVSGTSSAVIPVGYYRLDPAFVQKIEIPHLLARLKATTERLARSPDFNNSEVVVIRALAEQLIRKLKPTVDGNLYESFLRSAQGAYSSEDADEA
jgi:hypothetical protein